MKYTVEPLVRLRNNLNACLLIILTRIIPECEPRLMPATVQTTWQVDKVRQCFLVFGLHSKQYEFFSYPRRRSSREGPHKVLLVLS